MSPKACNLKRNSGNLFSIDIVKKNIHNKKNAKTPSVYIQNYRCLLQNHVALFF